MGGRPRVGLPSTQGSRSLSLSRKGRRGDTALARYWRRADRSCMCLWVDVGVGVGVGVRRGCVGVGVGMVGVRNEGGELRKSIITSDARGQGKAKHNTQPATKGGFREKGGSQEEAFVSTGWGWGGGVVGVGCLLAWCSAQRMARGLAALVRCAFSSTSSGCLFFVAPVVLCWVFCLVPGAFGLSVGCPNAGLKGGRESLTPTILTHTHTR